MFTRRFFSVCDQSCVKVGENVADKVKTSFSTHTYKSQCQVHNCSFAVAAEMEVKSLVLCLLMLGIASSQYVADVSRSRWGPGLLQQAIRYLVNYTAAEAEERLNMNNIGSTVAAIAYEELTEKLGRNVCR